MEDGTMAHQSKRNYLRVLHSWYAAAPRKEKRAMLGLVKFSV